MEVRAATPADTAGYLALFEVVAAEGTWIGAELPLDDERLESVVEGRLRRHHRRSSGQLWDSLAMGLLLDVDSPGSSHPDAAAVTR